MPKKAVHNKIKQALAKRKRGDAQTTTDNQALKQCLKTLEKRIALCTEATQSNISANQQSEYSEHVLLTNYMTKQLNALPSQSAQERHAHSLLEQAQHLLSMNIDALWWQLACKLKSVPDVDILPAKDIKYINTQLSKLRDITQDSNHELYNISNTTLIQYADNINKMQLIEACAQFDITPLKKHMGKFVQDESLIKLAKDNVKTNLSKAQLNQLDKSLRPTMLRTFIESLDKLGALIQLCGKHIIASKIYVATDYNHYTQTQKKLESLIIDIKHWYNQYINIILMMCDTDIKVQSKSQEKLVNNLKPKAINIVNLIKTLSRYNIDKNAVLLSNVIVGKYFNKVNEQHITPLAYNLVSTLKGHDFIKLIYKNFKRYTPEQKYYCLKMFEHIMNDCQPENCKNEFYSKEFFVLMKKFIDSVKSLSGEKNYAECIESLSNALNTTTKQKPSQQNFARKKPIKGHANELIGYFRKISNVIANDHMLNLTAQEFVNLLENVYTTKMAQIDTLELTTYQQYQHVLNKLSSYINLHEYFVMDKAIHSYILLSIFYNIRDEYEEKIYFTNLDKVLHFYNLALQISIENKKHTALYVIKRALNEPNVVKLIEAKNIILPQLSKVNSKLNFISSLINKESEPTPHIELFLKQNLVKISQIKNFDKKLYAGFLAVEYEEVKQNIQQSKDYDVNVKVLTTPLIQLGLAYPYATSYQVDDTTLNERIKNISNYFMPIKTPLQIAQFESPGYFAEFIGEQVRKANILEFDNETTQTALTRVVSNWIKQDYQHKATYSIFHALWVLKGAFIAQCIPGESFYGFLQPIFENYHQLIEKQVDAAGDNEKQLARFFTAFNKSKLVNTILHVRTKPEGDEKELFDTCRQYAKKIMELEQTFASNLNSESAGMSQQAMSELLHAIITGTEPDHSPFSEQLAKHVDKISKKYGNDKIMSHLLPEVYPDDPASRLEKSRYFKVGNEEDEAQNIAVYDFFKTDKLMNDFVTSFPWALQISHIDDIEGLEQEENLNLLYTDDILPLEVQCQVMRGIFIAYDILGKLTGFDGDLCLHNYATIKRIITTITELNKTVQQYKKNTEEAQIWINDQITKLEDLNYKLYDNPPPDLIVIDNHIMNSFCHLNQAALSRLTGQAQNDEKLGLYPEQPYDDNLRDIIHSTN